MKKNKSPNQPKTSPSFFQSNLESLIDFDPNYESELKSKLQSEKDNSIGFSRLGSKKIPEIHIRIKQKYLFDFLDGKSIPLKANCVLCAKPRKKSRLPVLEILNDRNNILDRYIIIRNLKSLFYLID